MQHEKEKRAIMDGLTAAAGAAFGHKFGYDRIGDNDFILVVDDEDPFEIVPVGEGVQELFFAAVDVLKWLAVSGRIGETGIKTIPMEKKFKKAKWLSGEALQIAVKRSECRVPKNSKKR